MTTATRDRGIALTVFPGATSAHPTEAILPRFHFGRPTADGAIPVEDRILCTRVVVYLAKTPREFDGGHIRERWYVRRPGEGPVNTPQSRPFAGFADAAQAIRDGSWDLLPSHADRKPMRKR